MISDTPLITATLHPVSRTRAMEQLKTEKYKQHGQISHIKSAQFNNLALTNYYKELTSSSHQHEHESGNAEVCDRRVFKDKTLE